MLTHARTTQGTAVVCLLTSSMTLVRQRIDVALPRKHKSLAASAHEKALSKFHQQVYTAIAKLLALPAIRLIILASPGFTKDAVYDYLFAEATRRGDKLLTGSEVKRKFLRVACASPHIHSLMEVLRTPEVRAVRGKPSCFHVLMLLPAVPPICCAGLLTTLGHKVCS